MADEKVKARTRKVEVSSLLSIDSPGVVWIINSIDDLEQVPGTIFAGGGGSGEPAPSPPPDPPDPPLPEPTRYVAYCSLAHDPSLPGCTVDGHWMTVDTFEFSHAQQDALSHEDQGAAVFIYVNGVVVGPVSGP